MKRSGSASIWVDLYSGGLLKWGLWLLGLPACVAVLLMFVWPERTEPPSQARIDTVQRWIEPLPQGTSFDLEGFRSLLANAPDFARATWTTIPLPDAVKPSAPSGKQASPAEPMARAWFRFHYTVPDDAAPEQALALYGTRVQGGAYSVWVDRQLVTSRHREWPMQWMSPLFVTLPLAANRPGDTLEVALAVPHRLSQGYAVGSLYFGKDHELRPWHNLREFFHRTLPMLGLMVVGLMGVLSLATWLRRRTELEHLWLALLSVGVILSNLKFTHDFSDDPAIVAWYNFIVEAATNWLFLLFIVFVFRFHKLRLPLVETLLTLFTLAATLITTPLWDWQITGLMLRRDLLIYPYVIVAAILTWHAVTKMRFENWLFCLAIWFFLFAAWHDLNYLTSRSHPDSVFLFPYGAFLLFIVAQLLLQRRYVEALGQIEESGEILARKLREREAAILSKQAELFAAQRQQAMLDERGRLIQEIHDGIGSVLMNSLVSLDRGRVLPAQAADVVQVCLDEVGLVAGSLAPEIDSLGALLSALRTRWSDRLSSAGLQLVWDLHAQAQALALNANQALELMRVLQEVIANALKHAAASQLLISAQPQPNGQVLLTLQDDGKGFDVQQVQQGRGLRHIRTRLGRLGAVLTLHARPGRGVRLEIALQGQNKAT